MKEIYKFGIGSKFWYKSKYSTSYTTGIILDLYPSLGRFAIRSTNGILYYIDEIIFEDEYREIQLNKIL